MEARQWDVTNFPGRELFSPRPGVAAMLSQELDGLAEARGLPHGIGTWPEAVTAELAARARTDDRYLARLRRVKGERAPGGRRGRQAWTGARNLLDVIAEERAARRMTDAGVEAGDPEPAEAVYGVLDD